MKKFWTCWVEGTTGGYGRQQPSLDEAKRESERLVQLPGNTGKRVYVLECLGATSVTRTNWELASKDSLIGCCPGMSVSC